VEGGRDSDDAGGNRVVVLHPSDWLLISRSHPVSGWLRSIPYVCSLAHRKPPPRNTFLPRDEDRTRVPSRETFMAPKHILENRRDLSGRRTDIRYGPGAIPRALFVSTGATPQTDAIGTWEDEGGSLAGKRPAPPRYPQRSHSVAPSDGGTTHQEPELSAGVRGCRAYRCPPQSPSPRRSHRSDRN
jgi:hypothetical protein